MSQPATLARHNDLNLPLESAPKEHWGHGLIDDHAYVKIKCSTQLAPLVGTIQDLNGYVVRSGYRDEIRIRRSSVDRADVAEQGQSTPRREEIPTVSQKLLARLDDFRQCKRNWDGEGADPIAAVTIKRAETIVRATLGITTREPFIGATRSGELILLWSFPDKSIIEVYADELLSSPDEAVVSENGTVSEVPLTEPFALQALLLKHATKAATVQ